MMISLEEFALTKKKLIVAHRGSSGTAPENTMASFEIALADGADMVEADVQMTRDGRIVVIHDRTLERTTNGIGNVRDYTYEELKEFDAGSWFGDDFVGQRIPLLDDVIKLIKNKAFLNIEIKSKRDEHSPEMIEELIQIVENNEFTQYTLFASFNYEYLKYIKSKKSNYYTAAIKIPSMEIIPSHIADETGCEAYICSINELSDELREDAKSSGIVLGVYSVDTAEDFEKATRYDVNAFATNYPGLIKKFLK